MENKQLVFVSTSNSMFRSSMSHSHGYNQDGGDFGVIGLIGFIIIPLIVWLIIRDKDNGK